MNLNYSDDFAALRDERGVYFGIFAHHVVWCRAFGVEPGLPASGDRVRAVLAACTCPMSCLGAALAVVGAVATRSVIGSTTGGPAASLSP